MARHVLVAGVLVLAALAGCIQSPADVPSTTTEQESRVLETLGAVAAPTNVSANGTWFVVPVRVEPTGGLSAFEWTVPTGSLVPWGYNEMFDEKEQLVVLEVALLGSPTVDLWGVVFFDEENQGLEAGAGYLSFAATSTIYGPFEEMPFESELRTTDFTSLGFDVKEGQVMRGLAIARGPEPVDAAIAFRVLDHDPSYPDSEEEPAASPALFVSERNGTAPLAITPRALATGFAFHAYFDILLGGLTPADPMMGIESYLGEPTFAWNAPPRARALGGPQQFEGSVTSSLVEGFDMVGADYFSMSHGMVRYELDVTLHDETSSASGEDAEVGFIGLLAGLPTAGGGAFALGDGTGDSSANLAIERIIAGGLFAATSMMIVEIGADLEDLFGVPAMTDASAGDHGSLVPATMMTSRGLVQRTPTGSVWTFALPGAEALQKL